MKLPEKLPTRVIQFSDGVGGWAQQKHRNDDFGITVVSTRVIRSMPFKQEYFIDSHPKEKFSSYKELKAFIEGQEAI